MTKFFKNISLFLLFSAVFYIICIIIFGHLSPSFLSKNLPPVGTGHLHSRLQDVKKIKNVDILFLGGSLTYRGFDTRLFEAEKIKSFNLGSSSQTPIQTKVLVEKYIDGLNPNLVILEVSPIPFALDGVESLIDFLKNDEISFNSIKMVLTIKDIKTYNVFVFDLFRQLTGLKDNLKAPIIQGDDTYITGGGYVEKKISYNTNLEDINPKKYIIRDKQLKAFKETVQLIKTKKINYILVQPPVTSKLYNSFANKDELDSLFSTSGMYFNFNKIICLSDSLHFYDAGHLNQNGVKLFNKKLIEIILQQRLLKNRLTSL